MMKKWLARAFIVTLMFGSFKGSVACQNLLIFVVYIAVISAGFSFILILQPTHDARALAAMQKDIAEVDSFTTIFSLVVLLFLVTQGWWITVIVDLFAVILGAIYQNIAKEILQNSLAGAVRN